MQEKLSNPGTRIRDVTSESQGTGRWWMKVAKISPEVEAMSEEEDK